jgi:hypothetical protein
MKIDVICITTVNKGKRNIKQVIPCQQEKHLLYIQPPLLIKNQHQVMAALP